MKIGLNDRSAQELIALIEHNGNCSPKHLVQLLITKAYKEIKLAQFPNVEDTRNAEQIKH
ncbi:hypothetical protein [Pseudomonas oryzihabitans]|uniref:hypothetical protein n=1 Tax=Pseudomonas oryzihabitans TaxID=47885 RepID=UPI002B1E7DB8|nr:hypothetical protein [Pseudomonas oryzihabitans]